MGYLLSTGLQAVEACLESVQDDVDETGIDRIELMAWSTQTLMAAAGQAKQQKILELLLHV